MVFSITVSKIEVDKVHLLGLIANAWFIGFIVSMLHHIENTIVNVILYNTSHLKQMS